MTDNNFEQRIQAATAVSKSGEWQEAATLWQSILDDMGNNSPPETYHRLARALINTDKIKEAKSVVDAGLEKYPKDVQILLRNAEILDQGKDIGHRINAWKSVIESAPDKAPAKAWIKLSRLYNSQGNTDQARQLIDKAINNHKLKDASLQLEALLLSGQQEDWKEAKRIWGIVEGSKIDIPEEGYVYAVRAFIATGSLKMAEAVVQEGLKGIPDSVPLGVEAANVYNSMNDWPKARQNWEKVKNNLEQANDHALYYQLCRFNLSVIERLLALDGYKSSIASYNSSNSPRTVAVATSFSKGYDQLKPHAKLNDNFDYFVYTDSPVDDLGIYKHKDLPDLDLDAGRLIRYVKMHPHLLFGDYQIAVWLDASIMVVDDIQPIIDDFIKSGKAIGSSPHSQRSNVYQEFDACIQLKKDDPEIIIEQREFYESQGFKGEGLTENGFLMFNLRHPNLAPAMDKWWEQVNKYSKRDQLSLGYALEQTGTELHPLMQPPQSVRDNKYLVLTQHGVKYTALDSLVKEIS